MKKLVVLLLLMLVLVGGSVVSSNSNNPHDKNLKHESNLSDSDMKRFFDDLGLPDIAEISLIEDHIVIPNTSKNI